jgi:lysine 2,3-aminomutase
MLSRYHPLYLNTQFNHPREITPEASQACTRLAGAGIPLGNQSVLLRGVNDHPDVMMELIRNLLRIRVRPYYVFHCQTFPGIEHFRVPIERGLEIMQRLRGHVSGLAIPTYMLDTPYGKVPLMPQYLLGREGDAVLVRTHTGQLWRASDPLPEEGKEVAIHRY